MKLGLTINRRDFFRGIGASAASAALDPVPSELMPDTVLWNAHEVQTVTITETTRYVFLPYGDEKSWSFYQLRVHF